MRCRENTRKKFIKATRFFFRLYAKFFNHANKSDTIKPMNRNNHNNNTNNDMKLLLNKINVL